MNERDSRCTQTCVIDRLSSIYNYIITMKTYTIIIALLFLTVSMNLFANPLSDPAIPDGEKIRYKVIKGDEVSWTTTEIRQEAGPDGRYYVISSWSDEQDSEIYIRNSDLIPFRSWVVKKRNDSEITEEINIKKMAGYDGEKITVIGTQDLIHVLRGFPFEKGKKIDLVFIGQEQSGEFFSMRVEFEKTEYISVNGKTYRAHKLKLVPVLSGIMKLAAGLFPKTYLWYSAEKPHYLLKYEGSAESGSGKQTIEIADYSISAR